MLHAGEAFGGRATDTLCGGTGRDEFRELFLQIEQFLVNPVILKITDLRTCLDVIGVIVAADFFGEGRVAGLGWRVYHEEYLARSQREKHANNRKRWQREEVPKQYQSAIFINFSDEIFVTKISVKIAPRWPVGIRATNLAEVERRGRGAVLCSPRVWCYIRIV